MADDKQGVLVRVPIDKHQRFNDLYPWHGSLTQFFLQALDEFLELSENQKTPSTLTQEAVASVVRKSY